MIKNNTELAWWRPNTAWYIVGFFAYFQFFMQSIGSVMGMQWQTSFHLDAVGLGNLSAVFFWAYVFMQIPVGLLYDRFSVRTVLINAATILALGCFTFAFTRNYYVALIARLFMGVGAAFGFVGLLKVTLQSFPPNRFAFMLGVAEGITMLGVTLSVMLMASFIAHSSWRVMMIICGVIDCIVLISIIRYMKKTPVHEQALSPSFHVLLRQLKTVLLHRQVIAAGLYGLFLFALISVFTALWGVPFITHTSAIQPKLAAYMVAIVFVGVALGGPINGYLTKLLGRYLPIMLWFAGLTALTTSILIFAPHLPVYLYFVLLFLIGLFSAIYLQSFNVIKDIVEPEYQATALAVVNMIIVLSGPILQMVVGFLLKTHFFHLVTSEALTYRLALGILPVGMFLAVLIGFFMQEPTKHEQHNMSQG